MFIMNAKIYHCFMNLLFLYICTLLCTCFCSCGSDFSIRFVLCLLFRIMVLIVFFFLFDLLIIGYVCNRFSKYLILDSLC
jgi:hypothetical protein